jgi:hypothetical protein
MSPEAIALLSPVQQVAMVFIVYGLGLIPIAFIYVLIRDYLKSRVKLK